jgi:hypothetical protein
MIGRIGSRLERIERAGGSRQAHLIVCFDAAEAGEARRFLGDKFGDLIFVVTGVRRPCSTPTERRVEWERMARENACTPPRFDVGGVRVRRSSKLIAFEPRQ